MWLLCAILDVEPCEAKRSKAEHSEILSLAKSRPLGAGAPGSIDNSQNEKKGCFKAIMRDPVGCDESHRIFSLGYPVLYDIAYKIFLNQDQALLALFRRKRRK